MAALAGENDTHSEALKTELEKLREEDVGEARSSKITSTQVAEACIRAVSLGKALRGIVQALR